MILQGSDRASMLRAWDEAQHLIQAHADELSGAVLVELRRFLALIEAHLLHGAPLDLDIALRDHERRLRALMEGGAEATAVRFGGAVLAGLDAAGSTGAWLATGTALSLSMQSAREAAQRFAGWSAFHVSRLRQMNGGTLAKNLILARGPDGIRRAYNASESVVHQVSQLATDSAGEFSGQIAARVWLSRLDGRERPTHNEAHGQHQPMGTPFLVGGVHLRFPHDPKGPAREIANCRCVTALRRKS